MPDASTRRAALDAERDVGSRRVVSIQMFSEDGAKLARSPATAPHPPPPVRQLAFLVFNQLASDDYKTSQ